LVFDMEKEFKCITPGNGIRAGKYGGWNFSTEENFQFSNLGTNLLALSRIVDKCGEGNTFVDLGVDYGVSSLCLTYDAIERENQVYGVDTQFKRTGFDLWEFPNYHMIQGDSSSVGKNWDTDEYGKVKLLFVDSIHVACQVATELYHWYPHMEDDSWIVFHDTNWPAGMHDLTWHPEVQEKGLKWDRPEVAVGRFFGITELFEKYGNEGFRYEDEYIRVRHRPESWGMTSVHIKKKKDFISNIDDWDQIFQDRNTVVGYFKQEPDTFLIEDIRNDE
tara:strand:- start:3200 stop:4027 length:828 start_codon:yes stop_codon:yes gene_type:complete